MTRFFFLVLEMTPTYVMRISCNGGKKNYAKLAPGKCLCMTFTFFPKDYLNNTRSKLYVALTTQVNCNLSSLRSRDTPDIKVFMQQRTLRRGNECSERNLITWSNITLKDNESLTVNENKSP